MKLSIPGMLVRMAQMVILWSPTETLRVSLRMMILTVSV